MLGLNKIAIPIFDKKLVDGLTQNNSNSFNNFSSTSFSIKDYYFMMKFILGYGIPFVCLRLVRVCQLI